MIHAQQYHQTAALAAPRYSPPPAPDPMLDHSRAENSQFIVLGI
jgi:hypothetical protein